MSYYFIKKKQFISVSFFQYNSHFKSLNESNNTSSHIRQALSGFVTKTEYSLIWIF